MSVATAIRGLHASPPQPLPFAPSLDIRAFLLQRSQGNVLVYSVTDLESDAEAIQELGGISRQYLNHRHEAMFASDWVDAPLFIHEAERRSVEGRAHVCVLVPWATTAGEPYFAVSSRADAERRIDAILERVRSGEDH